jgi:hypothetical protein
METESYLDKLANQSIEDLLMERFCHIHLPESTRLAHLAMPDLLNAMLDLHEKRGMELLTYNPPQWISGMYDDD